MSVINSTHTVNRLSSLLGIEQNSSGSGVNSTSIQGTETTSPSTVGIAQAVELNSEDLLHTLVLKDRLEGGAHLLSMVAIDDDL